MTVDHLLHVLWPKTLSLLRSWVAYAAMPAAALITAPILAQMLGPSGRGQLAGLLQPMVLASSISALGVPSAVTYFIGGGADPNRVLRISFYISLAMTLVVAIGLVLYSEPVSNQIGVNRTLMLLVWAAFLPSAFIAIRRSHIQALRIYNVLDLERVLASALRVALIIFLWLFAFTDPKFYAVAYMAAGLSASLVLLQPKHSLVEVSSARKLNPSGVIVLRYAVLASFGTIAAAMSSRLDQAIMPAIVPAAELGYYSVAVAVAEVCTIITLVSVRNILAEASAGIGVSIILMSVLSGGAGLALLIGFIFLVSPYIVPFFFGHDFLPSINLINVLLLGAFIAYWGSCASTFLAGMGRPGLASFGPAAGALCTAFLFWIQWHNMSAVTAAWIAVISQIVTLVVAATLTIWLIRR